MSEEIDAMQELEREAHRQAEEEKADKAFSMARARLVRGVPGEGAATHAFFASLALRLKARADWTIETAATDGTYIVYNPAWWNSKTPEQQKGVLVHEVLHVSNSHHARRGHREPARYNKAADLSINPLIEETHLALPPEGLFPGRGEYAKLPAGKAAEWYYDQIPPEPAGEGGGPGQDPGGCGGVIDPGDGSDAACRQSEAEWREAVAQAVAVARQRGKLPAAIDGWAEQVLNPRPDVAAALREFVTRHAKQDWSWNKPSRRFIGEGLYLPSRHGATVGDVVMCVDCSGSVSDDMLKRMGEQMEGVLQTYPGCGLTIVYHDVKPAKIQEWRPDDGPLVLHRPAMGGTDHRWLKGWLEENAPEAACCVALTDMETEYGDPPHCPVLWVAVASTIKAPWGQTVEVE